jgi:hypothetical protein
LARAASADDPKQRERGAGIAERISRLEPAAGVESGLRHRECRRGLPAAPRRPSSSPVGASRETPITGSDRLSSVVSQGVPPRGGVPVGRDRLTYLRTIGRACGGGIREQQNKSKGNQDSGADGRSRSLMLSGPRGRVHQNLPFQGPSRQIARRSIQFRRLPQNRCGLPRNGFASLSGILRSLASPLPRCPLPRSPHGARGVLRRDIGADRRVWPAGGQPCGDTFNEIVAANERMAQQLERVGQVVGKEGKTRQRGNPNSESRPCGRSSDGRDRR